MTLQKYVNISSMDNNIVNHISNNAYELLTKNCTATPLSNWIIDNTEDYYTKNPVPSKEEITLNAYF